MTDYQKYINALRRCAKQHERDVTSTGHIVVSDLCRDTANLLEELSISENPNKSEIPTSSSAEDDKVTLTFSKGTLKYNCKDYIVYNRKWFRSHYGAEIDFMFGDNQYIEPTTKSNLPHCQHTDEEIAKSFIEDVEAVKEQLPCGEQMDFPSTFDEFAKDYGFKDKDEIYTNGSELIPVFRVKQWLEHISTTKNDLAQERYQDLIEYFCDEKVAKKILEDRKEFKAWLERLRWNVKRADELARELEQIKSTTNLVPRNVVERIIKSPRTKEQMLLVLNSLPPQEPTTKKDLPHCQCTDTEIAKSFIEDVEAVKDQLPCGEMMDFPNTFDEFAKDYGFRDKKEIYTNGSELIPVFRVKQWLEHISTTKNNLGVENDLVSSIVEKISEKVTENREEFIFETIRPYCENVVQMKISKRDLEQALLKYYGKNDLGVDCINRAELLKAMGTWDKFGYSARYGLERLDKDDKEYIAYVKYDDMVNCVKGMPSVTSQEPTTKNNLGVDCISREEAIKTIRRYGVGCFDADEFSPEECERFVIGKLNELDSVIPKGVTVTDFADKCRECGKQKTSEHDKNVVLDKLRAEITTLQNRCYALTKGTMCAFCKYECEYKAESEDKE